MLVDSALGYSSMRWSSAPNVSSFWIPGRWRNTYLGPPSSWQRAEEGWEKLGMRFKALAWPLYMLRLLHPTDQVQSQWGKDYPVSTGRRSKPHSNEQECMMKFLRTTAWSPCLIYLVLSSWEAESWNNSPLTSIRPSNVANIQYALMSE